jgi:nitroreductase
MGDLDILTRKPKNTYVENPPDINPEEFQKVIESRRSVRIFTEESIPSEVLDKCLENALLAPNSSNLQPWEFYVIKDNEKKQKLVKYCLSQLAAKTASELIVCVARTDLWKVRQSEMLHQLRKEDGTISKGALTYYKKIVPLAYNQGPGNIIGFIKQIIFFFRGFQLVTPREPTSYSDMRVWANKSTALGCENLMLSLRAYGYDSCPMEGFDSKRIKKLLNLPNKSDICMVIGAGKRSNDGVFGKQIRMPSSKFILKIYEKGIINSWTL